MKFSVLRRTRWWLFAVGALATSMQCWANQPDSEMQEPAVLEQVLAVDDATLEALRGGFDWGQGLRVSFGLVRTVAINGELVHTTRFNVPDIARMVQRDAATDAYQPESLLMPPNVVQNGANNVALLSESISAATTIVQNSLNNQQISTLTEINTVVNSLSLIQTLNARTTMQEALLGGIGVR
jgi:hypothetical protein